MRSSTSSPNPARKDSAERSQLNPAGTPAPGPITVPATRMSGDGPPHPVHYLNLHDDSLEKKTGHVPAPPGEDNVRHTVLQDLRYRKGDRYQPARRGALIRPYHRTINLHPGKTKIDSHGYATTAPAATAGGCDGWGT